MSRSSELYGYQPTAHLRFVSRQSEGEGMSSRLILQQLWESSIDGEEPEWRDVELVDA